MNPTKLGLTNFNCSAAPGDAEGPVRRTKVSSLIRALSRRAMRNVEGGLDVALRTIVIVRMEKEEEMRDVNMQDTQ